MTSSSLAVLIDTSACAWGNYALAKGETSVQKHHQLFSSILRAIVAYSNIHLSLAVDNRLILHAYGTGIKSRVLFDSIRSSSPDSSQAILSALRNSLNESLESKEDTVSPPLAPSLAMAICRQYSIIQLITTLEHVKSGLLKKFAQTGNIFDQLRKITSTDNFTVAPDVSVTKRQNENGRIVIISFNEDFGSQHSLLMNLFFSAAKQHLSITVVSMVGTSALLHQAADITAGAFIEIQNPNQLLSALMTQCLTPGGSSMGLSLLKSSRQEDDMATVDYRAACFCHQTLVSSGWVCSVCLTVLCQFMPICPACNSVFEISVLPRRNRKRKTDSASAV